MSQEREKPGAGFFGWLGRQVGHIRKAIKTDVAPSDRVVFRKQRVDEAAHPADPDLILRRTTIDEAIVQPKNPTTTNPKRD